MGVAMSGGSVVGSLGGMGRAFAIGLWQHGSGRLSSTQVSECVPQVGPGAKATVSSRRQPPIQRSVTAAASAARSPVMVRGGLRFRRLRRPRLDRAGNGGVLQLAPHGRAKDHPADSLGRAPAAVSASGQSSSASGIVAEENAGISATPCSLIRISRRSVPAPRTI